MFGFLLRRDIGRKVPPLDPASLQIPIGYIPDGARGVPEPFTPAGLYPTTYDSGPIVKGNRFIVIADGVVGAETVNNGDTLTALVDAPGQTDANWSIAEGNIGAATETEAGIARRASTADVQVGADDAAFLTTAKGRTLIAEYRDMTPILWEDLAAGPFPTEVLRGRTWFWECPKSASRSRVGHLRIPADVNNAIIRLFVPVTVLATGAGNGDVRLSLDCSYTDISGLVTTVTTTILTTFAITNSLNARQEVNILLTGSIPAGVLLSFKLSRLPADAADTFTGDIGFTRMGVVQTQKSVTP